MFLDLSFWTVFWLMVSKLVRLLVKVPDKILAEEDVVKRRFKIIEYQNYFLSLIHSMVIIPASRTVL